MMFDFILSIFLWVLAVVPCWAGYKYFTKETNILPSKYIAERVIQNDDNLLIKAKSALYDYRQNPKFARKLLIKCREKLVDRYQQYKYMKKDNEAQIPRKYMELRMDEFFAFLETMPPF